MDKKNREDLDKHLQKFAVKGQEKLVGQLRQMLNPKQDNVPSINAESKKISSKEFLGRKNLFELMDSFRGEIKKYHQPEENTKQLRFELLCRPIEYPNNIDLTKIKKSLPTISAEHIDINKKQFDCFRIQDGNNNDKGYSVFVPENGIFYSRHITSESKKNQPDKFDPKVQSLVIADAFILLGKLYQNLGLNFRDRLDIVFRYNDATNLAVRSISPETFLPSTKYKKEDLTFYVVRQLHELLGRTADTTSEIIIELLKKLRYQGIVNKNFFVHCISKHLAGR